MLREIILYNSKIWAYEYSFLSPALCSFTSFKSLLESPSQKGLSWYALFYIIILPHSSSIKSSPCFISFWNTMHLIIYFIYCLSAPVRMWAPWKLGFLCWFPHCCVPTTSNKAWHTVGVEKCLLNKWVDKRRWLIWQIQKQNKIVMTDLDQEWCVTHSRHQINCWTSDKWI